MVGRTEHVAQLVDAFATTRRERSARTIRVAGPPGVGTSRLLTEFHEQLVHRHLDHHWWFGSCSRPAGLAFEPFAGLLSDCDGGVGGWLAEARGHADEPTMETLLLGGLVARLRAAANHVPVVLVVDSIDAADPSTVRLLEAIGEVIGDVAVLVVLAGRVVDDPSSSTATFLLEPLSDNEIRDLVRGAPMGDVDDIVAAAGGRPGVALALTTSDEGSTTLARMLSAIDPMAASAVTAIALAGNALPAHMVLEACDVEVHVLDRLVAHRVVRLGIDDAGSAEQVWVEAATGLARRRLVGLASNVADALEQVGAARIAATAWETAQRHDRAATAWERAARSAQGAGAVATAAEWLRRSIELGGTEFLARSGRTAATWSLAAGDWEAADQLASALLALSSRTHLDEHMGLLAIRYRACREAGLLDADAFLDTALSIADASSTPSVERADVLVLAALRLVLDDRAAALRRGSEALAMAAEVGDDTAIASANAAVALAQALAGDVDGALVRFDEALAIAENSGDLVTESRIASNKVYVLWRAGRPEDVIRVATEEINRLDARNIGWLGDQLGVARAVALTLMGRLDDASAAIEADRGRIRSADADALLTLLAAEIDILRGDMRAAEGRLDRVGGSPVIADPTVAAECVLQRAELALVRGDLVAARSIAENGLSSLTPDDQLAVLRLQLVVWRAGGEPTSPIDIEPVGRETAALGTEIAAWQRGEPEAWVAAAHVWETVPSPINAWRCRVQAARHASDLDSLYRLRQDLDHLSAPGLLALVETAIVEAGGRRTVQRIRGPLTKRELDVLALVAEGLTNRQIAQRLTISTRTVGVHVEHCLTKLAVATRGAAVHEARRLGVLNA